MTQDKTKGKEIVEGNKLIAEFMGYELKECHSPFYGKSWTKENLNDSPLYQFLEGNDERNLYFNSQWNWLMPVKEKIESLDNGTYGFSIDPWGIEIIEYESGKEEIIAAVIKEDKNDKWIELYYRIILDFITWYNKSKAQ